MHVNYSLFGIWSCVGRCLDVSFSSEKVNVKEPVEIRMFVMRAIR